MSRRPPPPRSGGGPRPRGPPELRAFCCRSCSAASACTSAIFFGPSALRRSVQLLYRSSRRSCTDFDKRFWRGFHKHSRVSKCNMSNWLRPCSAAGFFAQSVSQKPMCKCPSTRRTHELRRPETHAMRASTSAMRTAGVATGSIALRPLPSAQRTTASRVQRPSSTYSESPTFLPRQCGLESLEQQEGLSFACLW